MKIKKIIKKVTRNINKIMRSFDKNIYISIGENCLCDNILERNKLKSFSSPYASGRSNIEYLIAHEKESFKDFLNTEFLQHENLTDGKKVARNKKYVSTKNSYHSSCSEGFEFTHHDVLGSSDMKGKIQKRCERMMSLKNKNIIMLYHHRLCDGTDEELLLSDLSEFAKMYEKKNNTAYIFLFSQIIVENPEERRIERTALENVNMYKLYTLNEWSGEDQDIFWARCDDDLLKTMIDDMKSLRKN